VCGTMCDVCWPSGGTCAVSGSSRDVRAPEMSGGRSLRCQYGILFINIYISALTRTYSESKRTHYFGGVTHNERRFEFGLRNHSFRIVPGCMGKSLVERWCSPSADTGAKRIYPYANLMAARHLVAHSGRNWFGVVCLGLTRHFGREEGGGGGGGGGG